MLRLSTALLLCNKMEGDRGGRWEEEGGYIEYAERGEWECPGSGNAVYFNLGH